MSPEGFIECVYGPKTDVWAFGILIYELLHGDTPYSSCKLENDLRYQLSLRFDRGKVRSTITSDLKEVIFRCLEVDETKRISIQQLRDTNYFRRLYYFAAQSQLQLSPAAEEVKHPPQTHPALLQVERSLSNEGFNQLDSHESKRSTQLLHLGRNKEINSPTISIHTTDPILTERPKATFL
jgi:serine/threonine protein kinase